eukprot:5304924-Pleurochrysis_carterae.AAC.1
MPLSVFGGAPRAQALTPPPPFLFLQFFPFGLAYTRRTRQEQGCGLFRSKRVVAKCNTRCGRACDSVKSKGNIVRKHDFMKAERELVKGESEFAESDTFDERTAMARSSNDAAIERTPHNA